MSYFTQWYMWYDLTSLDLDKCDIYLSRDEWNNTSVYDMFVCPSTTILAQFTFHKDRCSATKKKCCVEERMSSVCGNILTVWETIRCNQNLYKITAEITLMKDKGWKDEGCRTKGSEIWSHTSRLTTETIWLKWKGRNILIEPSTDVRRHIRKITKWTHVTDLGLVHQNDFFTCVTQAAPHFPLIFPLYWTLVWAGMDKILQLKLNCVFK